MVAETRAPRQHSSRQNIFLAPLWTDEHTDYLRIDAMLPADHHARWLRHVVTEFDLSKIKLSYKGYGSCAFPVDLLLAFVLFMYSKGLPSPAEWVNQARFDDQSKWLLRGLQPSRSFLYTFRDRLEPYLDDLLQQQTTKAIQQGITSATRASLDGTFVDALASRHQLFKGERLDRRLLLLRLLVWLESGPGDAPLATRLAELPERVFCALTLWMVQTSLELDGEKLEDFISTAMALLELLDYGESTTLHVPSWVPTTPAGRQRALKRYEQAQQRLIEKKQPLLNKKKLSEKDEEKLRRMKVSVSEPESALGFDKEGTYRPLYNVQLVQATDAPLTLAFEVFSRNNDDGLLKPMMEKTQEQLGHPLKEVLVDGAFVTAGEVDWCEKAGITVYAPPKAETRKEQPPIAAVPSAPSPGAESVSSPATVSPEQPPVSTHQSEPSPGANPVSSPAAASTEKSKKLDKDQFRYAKEEDAYYCPEGKQLERKSQSVQSRSNGIELPVVVYQAAKQDCQGCPRRSSCTTDPKGRSVKRYEGEEALERLEARMETPAGKEIYKLRKQSVELGYADLKQHRGLREFNSFGMKRARVQAGLTILASNAIKIMRILRDRRNDPPPRSNTAAPTP